MQMTARLDHGRQSCLSECKSTVHYIHSQSSASSAWQERGRHTVYLSHAKHRVQVIKRPGLVCRGGDEVLVGGVKSHPYHLS